MHCFSLDAALAQWYCYDWLRSRLQFELPHFSLVYPIVTVNAVGGGGDSRLRFTSRFRAYTCHPSLQSFQVHLIDSTPRKTKTLTCLLILLPSSFHKPNPQKEERTCFHHIAKEGIVRYPKYGID